MIINYSNFVMIEKKFFRKVLSSDVMLNLIKPNRLCPKCIAKPIVVTPIWEFENGTAPNYTFSALQCNKKDV